MKRKVRPNVVSGGTAINLGNNLYYMRGKTHKQGGIDIGSNPKTGIEVENGEVVQTSPKGLRVFSAQPILNGISPANALLMGGNPNNIFNAQEAWKQVNHYNDDGTKFKIGGDDIPTSNVKKELIKLKNKINNKESIDDNPINKNIVSKNEDIERGYPYLYKGDAGLKFYKKKGVNGIIYGTSKYNESDLSDYEEIPYETVRKMLPKRDYIGGNDYRQRVVDKVPGLKSFIKAKAEEYGISPNLLFHRFLREGIVDRWTNIYNDSIYTDEQESFFRDKAGKMTVSGFGDLGLDDVGTNLLEGKYTLKNPNITWEESDDENEHGRQVKSAIFNNIWDGIEVKAAEMAYRQAELAKRGIIGDQFVNAAYNMGLNHKDLNNTDYVNKYYSVPNYFEFGGESKSYTPSKEIIDYIKKTEGFRDKWYKDGNGIDTIGYGFTGDNVKKLFADGITREQADKYFLETLNRRAKILERDTPNWNKLTQSQKDSLLSYVYNIGPGNYKRSKKLQEALLNEDWDNVANNISIGYNDKRNPGLRKRRDYERELFRRDIKSSFTGDEEKAFRDWYDRYARSQNLDPNPDAKEHYYDYRAYWKNRTPEQMNDEWKLGNHLPDTYKMPGHPTFSTESIYSTRKTPGGTWKKVGLGPVYDEQFIDSKYTRRLKTYKNVSFELGGTHTVQKGDTLTGIAKKYNIPYSQLLSYNRDIANPNVIRIGQTINLQDNSERSKPQTRNIREYYEQEAKLNLDNVSAIQGAKHKQNYAIIDKDAKTIKVYDINNNLLYESNQINTGKANTDYNTVTYKHKDTKKLLYGEGNNATPAGITVISSKASYHGNPSFQRARVDGNGNMLFTKEGLPDNIPSSIHWEKGIAGPNASNGCVRADGKTLQELNKYLDVGSMVYTLPQQHGSSFQLRDGRLNFVDNRTQNERNNDDIYRKGYKTLSDGRTVPLKYHRDINTVYNGTYLPIGIEDTLTEQRQNPNRIKAFLEDLYFSPGRQAVERDEANGISRFQEVKSKNRKEYADSIVNNKEAIMRAIPGLSNKEYNQLITMALGIPERETHYGTDIKQIATNIMSDSMLSLARRIKRQKDTVRSVGIGKIKSAADNEEMRNIYSALGINYTDKNMSAEDSAKMVMSKLAYTYLNEIKGRTFVDANGNALTPEQALYYAYTGNKKKKIRDNFYQYEKNYPKEHYNDIINYGNEFNITQQFVDSKYTKNLRKYQNVSFALGGDDLKQNGYIEPSVITVPLPKKFKGSQAAARRYAEGYQFGKKVANERDKTVPYIVAASSLPFVIGEGVAGGIATNAAINAFRAAHPILSKGISTALTIDGIRNAFTKNGIQKTVRLAKEGKTGRAVLSGLGDVADLAGFIDIANTGRRILNPAYRSLHFYNTITPFSYDDPIKRGAEWVKNMIANTPVNIDNPLWMIGKRGEQTKKMANEVGGVLGWRNSSFTDKGRIALEARDDAFRIYNGLPQKYGTFVKNKNGTYSYNLSKLKYENGSFKPVIGENYDTIGAAGGRVKESILNNLDGDVVVRHEDLWDLQPFKNKNTARIIDDYINNGVQKLREKITFPLSRKSKLFRPLDNSLNRFRENYHLSESKYANKINKFFNDFEAGQITGSKPFKLDTKFSGHSTYDFIDDLGTGHPIRYIDGPAQNVLFNTKFPDEITKFNYSNVNINDYVPNIKMTKKYGGIHIKPSKRGTFTAAAKRHHMSVQEFARTVLNNRARFSAAMVKKANFARNASKWHKKELGGDMTKQYYITKDNIYSLGGSSKRKAPLGTKYTIDENGRIVPINVPNTGINIANIGEINRLLDPVTVTDSAPKTPSITGRAEIIPQINQSILVPNSHVIQRRLPVSIQDIVNPITSPRDASLTKPDFNSTMLSAFPNPDFDGTVGTIKEKSSTGVAPRNPYYSRLNVGLRRAGNYIRNNPDLIGLGVNLTGNLAASLINRSAIKGMRYGDAPIPISAQKLPTEVNIEPQVSSIRENVAGQERLIADNTADSRVALARRQRVRNQGAQQYQTLFGNKLNTELQLLTADRLNRQGVDAQNVTQYNQWRRGLYDFENRRREMLAENSVAGINNAAEAIAGERGYLARREARKRDLLNMGLIAATSPNAQNVIGSKEFEEFLRKIGYDGNFSLLRKRLNG